MTYREGLVEGIHLGYEAALEEVKFQRNHRPSGSYEEGYSKALADLDAPLVAEDLNYLGITGHEAIEAARGLNRP